MYNLYVRPLTREVWEVLKRRAGGERERRGRKWGVSRRVKQGREKIKEGGLSEGLRR